MTEKRTRGTDESPEPAALLRYAVTPQKIAFSASADALSIVELTLTASNPSADAVEVSGLEFMVPSSSVSSSDALTTVPNAKLVSITAGAATPWAVLARGDASWRALPLPPATNVGPHQTLVFQIANLVVNEAAGTAYLRIEEKSGGDVRQALAPVDKAYPVDGGGEKPRIEKFSIEPAQAAQGADVTISWNAQSATSGVLQPRGTPLPDPNQGTFTLPLRETTTFTLRLTGPGGTADAEMTATVMPVRIDRFVADPPTPVAPNTEVRLIFDTVYATQVSIDQGIGIVPPQGSHIVRPTQTTLYTLTALGLSPQTRVALVTVLTR